MKYYVSLDTALVSKHILCNAAYYSDSDVSPCSKALPKRPSVSYAAKKVLTFYGTQRFVSHVHKSLPNVPPLTQINPVHTNPSYLFSDPLQYYTPS